MTTMVLSLGQTVITPGAKRKLDTKEVLEALTRHMCGDFGEASEEDTEANNEALLSGGRIISSYSDKNGVKFWIITEGDRSVTTILLPEEY